MNLVRVLFFGAPAYWRRVLCLIVDKFSSRVTYQVVTYAITGRIKTNRLRMNDLHLWLFGEKALRQALIRFEPDIVVTDGTVYGAQFKISSYWTRKRKPMIVQLRGDPWSESMAHFTREKPLMKLLRVQPYAYSWSALILARKVAPVCEWLQGVVKHHIPGKKCKVIYPPVDPDQYFEEEGLTFQKPAVAVIQNHSVYPKVAGLMKFKRVVEKLPSVNFYIAEGETADQPFLPLVKQHYSDLHNAHFVSGIRTPADVRKMLTAADCYVLATELDCCPTTVLQASLVRRPVIVSRVGGVPETVSENITGWTVRNNVIDDWVRKINLILTNHKLNRTFGENGRKMVSERFGTKTIANQIEKLVISELAE